MFHNGNLESKTGVYKSEGVGRVDGREETAFEEKERSMEGRERGG